MENRSTKPDLKSRSTRTLETPSGHEVVIYDYITGGELRQFQAIFLADMNASDLTPGTSTAAPNPAATLDKIKASTMLEAQELLVDLLVVSVDGETEDTKQMVLNMKPEDTDYVISELDKYTTDAEGKKK